jgi:secondary thiamine-phosphate synthase enzyme
MKQKTLEVRTGTELVTDLTPMIAEFGTVVGDGLLSIFAPHATAGIALMELGSGSERDLAKIMDRIFPRDLDYRHRHGYEGHGADHLVPVFISPSITVPVNSGRLVLGTWQSVVLVDPNRDNSTRRVILTAIAPA